MAPIIQLETSLTKFPLNQGATSLLNGAPTVPLGMIRTQFLLNLAQKQFGDDIITGLKDVKYEDIPQSVCEYTEAHPCLTVIQFVALLTSFCGGQIAISSYWLAGDRQTGSSSRFARCRVPTHIRSHESFQHLPESAAVGGYSAAAMDAIVHTASAFGFGAVSAAERLKVKGNGSAGL